MTIDLPSGISNHPANKVPRSGFHRIRGTFDSSNCGFAYPACYKHRVWEAVDQAANHLDLLDGDCRVVDAIYAVNDVRRRTLKTEG